MRFASWNCRSGGRAKWEALSGLGMDVAVLCETLFTTSVATASGQPGYVLVPRDRCGAVRSGRVGAYDDRVAAGAPARSDHVPVFVDIDW